MNSQAYHVGCYLDGESTHRNVTVHINAGDVCEVTSGRAAGAIDLGAVALIPGLVNAHTHLEFSLFADPIPTAGRFTDWIRSVVKYRREHPENPPAAIRSGVIESIRAGTTLIGEIATVGWSDADYSSSGFHGCIFQEVLGLGDERVATQFAVTESIAAKHCTTPAGAPFDFGLSPHAPYSVHPDLFQNTVRMATDHKLPIAMHLAETTAELDLLTNGTGDFRDLLTDFGVWRDGIFGGQRPLDYLHALAGCQRVLVIHGNYLDDEELQFLASQPNMTLVYCPRTHAAFGHTPHPWQRVLELGGRVAIGTDSRASNPDLSLFAELQFLAARHPEISHLELLRLGTTVGRQALVGEQPSTRADLCLVEWNGEQELDPAKSLFSPQNRVVGTMIEGNWVHLQNNVSVCK